MAKKNNPDEKKIKEIIDKANSSGANFIYRLKQEDRSHIPDWEVDGSIATHKMRAEIDNNGRAIVFPDVQEIGGVLYDFTDPKNGRKPWDSMDSAIQNNDTVIFDSLDDAIWFSENYKNYYPKFDKYKEGGRTSKWKPSESILNYVKSVERFSPVIYKDGNGVETIGYGFTDKDLINKYRGKRMSKKEAERIFMEEKVPEFTGYVISYTENFDKLTDNQRDALFSYVYNIGSGNYRKNNPNLHKALQNKDWMTAAQYIDFGYKDEKNKGLRIRRNYERELFGYASDEEGNVYPIKTEEEEEVQEESVDQPTEGEGENKILLNSILGIKNDLEMQHPVSTTRDEAFREARKKGLKVFTWDGKKYNTKMKKDGGPVDEDGEDGGAKYRYIASMDNASVGWDIDEKPEMEEGGFVPDWVLQRNKLINRRGVSRCKDGGEANKWWEDPEERDRTIKKQEESANQQEKRRKLIDQARSDLKNGEIDEDEFKRIVGFSNSGIGDLIISKDGNGEEIGAIINSLLNNIDVDKVKKGINDAKEGKEYKNKEDAYPYKLMAESLLTLADVASSTPGMLRLYDKMGLRLMPLLKTIAESSKIQTIAGLSNMGVDGSQIALDPEGDNAFNYAGILGGAAEAIGGTNMVRNTSLMGRYGDRIDDVLDIANPIISLLGIADDVSEKREGGVISNSDFIKDASMARDALRMDSSHNLSYSYIPQNDASQHSFDIESLIKESSGIKPYDDMPDIKKHKVHKGDTLWSISKKTGVHIDDIILYNPQIKDINRIEVGDEVNLEAPISNPKVLDYKEIKKKESVLNKSGDNAAIIKSVQHNNNFAIVNKKKKVIEVYSPDNELLYTGRIGTGKSGDNYNTITYQKKDGNIIDGKGNNSTPAGITMVTGKSTYHGAPAFIRSRYNKKTGEWDDNIASSMHWGASDGSNGCVRLIGDTANELDRYIKQGSMVYTLPEKDGSRFMVRDGMLSYIADNPYGKDEKGDPKRYWDDYNTFNDKTYKPIDISQIDSDININVNHASMSPKAIARDLLLRFVDTGDRNENVNAFISGIEDYKKAIMADTGIDSATYNDLADIALGIAEQESKFGTSVKYALKNALTQEHLDLLKTIKGGVKGVTKDLNNIDEITWDGVLEHFKKPISYRSNGITQIKTKGDNYRTRVLYDKYGIDEESLKNPYMSGAGTMLRLASIYRDEVAGRKFKGPEGDIDPMDAVLYKWSGRNRLLRSGKANPKLDEYHNNVKKYASNFRINTVDKFDERLGGDEATVPDKPVMNIDDVTPSFVWGRSTGLSSVNGKRQSIPLYAEGGVVKKQLEAYKYLTGKRGMSKIQALAIIGNLMAESGLKDDIYGDNKTSYGIQQWHNEHMDKLFKHAKKKGHSTPTFKDQLEFLADEYEGKTGYSNFLYTRKGKEGPGYYNYSRQDFMNADNLKDAVVAWNQGAGRPHKSVIRNDDRYNYAMEVAKNLGLDIEENSVSSYGQMGFGDDGEITASVTLPEVEVAAALPNPEAQSQERQSEEDRFRTWTETYGKDIINHLLTLDGKKDGDDDDYSMMYKQHEKESEEDKKMALINAVLPNIQLRIKGVTDN